MDPPLIRAAQRAAVDPFFLAHRLGPDLPAAAVRLGITEEAAVHLYLCPTPKTVEELRAIAARGWATEEQLWEVMGW